LIDLRLYYEDDDQFRIAAICRRRERFIRKQPSD